MSSSRAPFSLGLILVPARMRDDCPWHPSPPVACGHCGYAIPLSRVRELPPGTRLGGLAPIGVKWSATITRNGKIKPDGNCPAGEFAPTSARIGDVSYPIE